jgi:hypothetical protein
MAIEYKVTVDQSMKGENDPKAIDKKMSEMSAGGWKLAHVTSVTQPGGDIMVISRIYLFWERMAT